VSEHGHSLQELAIEARLRTHVRDQHGGSIKPELGLKALRTWHHLLHETARKKQAASR